MANKVKRTTSRPSYAIFLNEKELSSNYPVHSYVVSRAVNKVPTAKLILMDGKARKQDFELSSSNQFIPGSTIEIRAGYSEHNQTIFKGILVTHCIKTNSTGRGRLVLELKGECVKMTVGRKSRYHSQDSDKKNLSDLLGLYNFESSIEAMDTQTANMVQYHSSDWDFMLQRADINGKLVYANDDLITIKAPTISDTPVFTATWGEDIASFEAEIDARDQYKEVIGHSFKMEKGKEIAKNTYLTSIKSATTDFTDQGEMDATELANVIGLGQYEMQHSGALDQTELQAWVDAKMMRSRLAKVRGRVRILGLPEIQLGDTIELQGLSKQFNGKAFVSGIVHERDAHSKYWTEVQFGLCQEWFSAQYTDIMKEAASGLVPGVKGLLNGVVVEIPKDKDEDHQYQVKVHIPVMDTTSSTSAGVWARVGQAEAGTGKKGARGTFLYPEIGDEVIVGFFNDDPRDPVVLGSLYSNINAAPVDTEEHNIKGYVSRNQFKMLIDDDSETICLETPEGKKITLDDGNKNITIEDKHKNKIVMSKDGISFESSKDIDLKATTGKISLSALEIESKATTSNKSSGGGGSASVGLEPGTLTLGAAQIGFSAG